MANPAKKVNTTPTSIDTKPTTTIGPASRRDPAGFYRNVSEPVAYDIIRTADGRKVKTYSHVIGRDC